MFVVIGISLLLFFIEPKGALVVIIALGLASFLFFINSKKYITSLGKDRQLYDGLRIKEVLGGVKVLGKEEYFFNRYASYNLKFAQSAQKQAYNT